MPLDQFRIDGTSALVTGGNRGIGHAIARLFVEAGARCLVTGRSRTPDLEPLIDADPGSVVWLAADVTDPATPDALVAAALDRLGRLDILVNNAGVAAHGPFHEFDDAQLDHIMGVNLIAPFRIARAAVRPMLGQGAGSILRRTRSPTTPPRPRYTR